MVIAVKERGGRQIFSAVGGCAASGGLVFHKRIVLAIASFVAARCPVVPVNRCGELIALVAGQVDRVHGRFEDIHLHKVFQRVAIDIRRVVVINAIAAPARIRLRGAAVCGEPPCGADRAGGRGLEADFIETVCLREFRRQVVAGNQTADAVIIGVCLARVICGHVKITVGGIHNFIALHIPGVIARHAVRIRKAYGVPEIIVPAVQPFAVKILQHRGDQLDILAEIQLRGLAVIIIEAADQRCGFRTGGFAFRVKGAVISAVQHVDADHCGNCSLRPTGDLVLIRELIQKGEIRIHLHAEIIFDQGEIQHCHLLTGDAAVWFKEIVAHALDDSVLIGKGNSLFIPCPRFQIGKGSGACIADILFKTVLQKAVADLREHGAGQRGVRLKFGRIAVVFHDAGAHSPFHILIVPSVLVQIRKFAHCARVCCGPGKARNDRAEKQHRQKRQRQKTRFLFHVVASFQIKKSARVP